jgi:hypothetical protein
MIDKVKTFITNLNKYGIPVPMLRDPKTGLGSVSLSMLFVSFNVVLLGLIGKWAKQLDIDLQQSIYWFMICAGLYFGRSLTKNENKVDLNKESE